tara:strand:- start:370 stop:573 length:204 start_codon:yes stop_codon:yes gene_type:complete
LTVTTDKSTWLIIKILNQGYIDIKKNIPIPLSIFVAFVFLQSLILKFAEWFSEPADISVLIFFTASA